jgi:HD domain
MRTRTVLFVSFVALLAALWTVAMILRGPAPAPFMVTDALILCGLAVTAEVLSYVLPRSATGTIAFIPYLAAVLIVPSWPGVVGVILVKASVETIQGRALIKRLLNLSAHTLMELAGITTYLALGGVGFHALGHSDLTTITRVAGLPALLAFAVALFVNNVIVHIAIALSTGRSMKELLHENQRPTAGIDLVAIPLVFIFAWVYVAFGAIAAAALWVPILGLRQVHRTNLELEQTNEELLELMVKSLEARDPYTSGHSRRVKQFSMTIGRAVGLSDKQIDELGRAALLHDVGKIYEKYASVLSKQDKLTPEEWAVIRDHPDDGANLIATMTKLRTLIPAVRHHHENWDGTGYPIGLAGENIPLAARIIRFADTIDAMTTERPYRGPLTETQVKNELVRCRETQFDPEITDRLLASPLWSTLFTPVSSDVSIASLAVLAARSSRAATPRRNRLRLGA